MFVASFAWAGANMTTYPHLPRAIGERFDYQAEADKTCSIEWGAYKVDRNELVSLLQSMVETSQSLNLMKKLLFRGKTREELGFLPVAENCSINGLVRHEDIDLVHGVIGVLTEAGEAAEILLDLICARRADRVNAVEECGDLRWYINRILRWANVTDEECERANIAKLHGRGFQFGFNKQADSNRDLQNERGILERGVCDTAEPRTSDMADLCEAERLGTFRDPSLRLPLGPHGDEPPA